MSEPETIPHDILRTLFRALVWCGDQVGKDEKDLAWAWLEKRNRYEEMCQ